MLTIKENANGFNKYVNNSNCALDIMGDKFSA